MLAQTLQNIGLTAEQTEIYLSLLSNGPQTAGQLAKSTKVQRTYIYQICKELLSLGLASQVTKNRGTTYQARSPDHLVTIAQENKSKVIEAHNALEGVLSELKDKYAAVEEKPIVTVYEGENGIKKAHFSILAEKKEILAYLVINPVIDKTLDSFWREYFAIRIRDQIFVRAITSDTKDGIAYKNRDTHELRETRLVPSSLFQFSIEKNIVGNKIAFFSTREGKLIATIIENKAISDAERSIFELAWNQAGMYTAPASQVTSPGR